MAHRTEADATAALRADQEASLTDDVDPFAEDFTVDGPDVEWIHDFDPPWV